MEKRIVPEAFHPGEYIREDAEELGWTPGDLAAVLGYKPNVVSDLLVGRRSVTPEIAHALGDAFGTGAQYWLNLQSAYKLSVAAKDDDAVTRRARLYEKVPVREIQRRGWIEESTSVDVLEAQVCRFLEIRKIDDDITFVHAARKSTDYSSTNSAQTAWLMRAKKLADALQVENPYSGRMFEALMKELATLLEEPQEIRHVPEVLSKYGIRFLIVEHLPKTKIDGACFWLGKDRPVIVLSLRYDRIDCFWHSLGHELHHVKRREGRDDPLLDTSMFGDEALPENEKPNSEREADAFAAAFLVNQDELEDFIQRNDPSYSRKGVLGFSMSINTHPGIVVGQLHYRYYVRGKGVPYSHFRPMLVKVRNTITETALTDGWGRTISV